MVKVGAKENGEGTGKRKWQRHMEKKIVKVFGKEMVKEGGKENGEGMWTRKW